MTIASRPVECLDLRPELPGDKSITHRAYLFSLLGQGAYTVRNPNRGEDCEHTLDAVRKLGVAVEVTGTEAKLQGPGDPSAVDLDLDLGNSGTGFRLLAGIVATRRGRYRLTGDPSLRSRPMERIAEPLRRMGAKLLTQDGRPPLTIDGSPLHGAEHRLPVASAQVKSALLLAGVQAMGETRVVGGGGSRDHTERMLRGFGITISGTPDDLRLTGGQTVVPTDIVVPGDPSAAAFYLAAAAIVPGSRVAIEGVSANPTRTAAAEMLESMGLDIRRSESDGEGADTIEPRMNLDVRGGTLRGIHVPADRVPGVIDELPLLAICAAFGDGESRFEGAAELRYKESDRLEAMAEGLAAIGADIHDHSRRVGDPGLSRSAPSRRVRHFPRRPSSGDGLFDRRAPMPRRSTYNR